MPGRWSVLAGAWSIYAAFVLLVATTGALVPQIQADLNLSDSQMGLVLGAWQLLFVASAIPAGRVLDRFGARRALLMSMTIMLASGFGRALAVGPISLFLAVAALGIGAPVISVGAPKVAANLFEDRDRRTAVAIYSTAPGIGGVLGVALPANVVGPLVGDNWRTIFVVLTAIASLALVIWAFVSRGLDNVMAPGVGPSLSQYRAIARTPVVRFVLVISVINFFFVHGTGQWLVAIITSAGWSVQEAGLWAALGNMASLVASFVLARLATPSRRPFLMIGSLLAGAAGLGLLLSTQPVLLFLGLMSATGSRVALMPLLILMMMDHGDVGPERIAAATGLFFTTAQLGGVIGPAATGFVSDLTGGFRVPLIMHSGVMLLVAVVIGFGYRRALR